MKSMTGFGRASGTLDNLTLTVQVSSVNRKSLDLSVTIPPEWESLESLIGEFVRKYARRGKVHVDIEVSGSGTAQPISWDNAAVEAYLLKIEAFLARFNKKLDPTPELLWNIANSQRKSSTLPSVEVTEPVLMPLLNSALSDFAEMRKREGTALLADFRERLSVLHKQVIAIAERRPDIPKIHRELLLQRLRQAGLDLNLDDERVLKEVALFADRCDITEEITRLRSHFEQFATLLEHGDEIGRKAEFILQEIGREVHTIGSKANDLQISKTVIELKNELERVREQIANVE